MENKAIQILIKARDLSAPVLKGSSRNVRAMTNNMGDTIRRMNHWRANSRELAQTQQAWNNTTRQTNKLMGTMTKGLAVGAGAGWLFKSQFVDTAAQFEKFNKMLEQSEGSQAKGRQAFQWINDFARTTPQQFDTVLDSYIKLKNFGLDPTNGSLKAIVDQNAALGGSQEKMRGIIIAVGQAWSKQKLQGEETLQLIERGVPVWEMLENATGRTSAELQDLQQKGKLGRTAIKLLMEQMGKRNAGASAKQMKTFNGLMSNSLDMITRFKLLVMDSGLFEYMKSELSGVLKTMNEMEKSGALKTLAKDVAQDLMKALKMARGFAIAAWKVLRVLGQTVSWLADKVGGFENLFKIIMALMVGKWLLSVLGFAVAVGKLMAAFGAVGFLSNALVLFSNLGTVILPLVAGALKTIITLLIANPIGAIVMAIAGAAFLIYKYWEPIKGFFVDLWSGIKSAFEEGFLNGVIHLIETFNPVSIMLRLARKMATALVGALQEYIPKPLQGIANSFMGTEGGTLQRTGPTLSDSPRQGERSIFDVNLRVDSEGRPEVRDATVRGGQTGDLTVDVGTLMGAT